MLGQLQKVISATVIFVGCFVLAGWALDATLLKSVAPGLPEMVPNTALCFVLCGGALALRRGDKQRLRRLSQALAFAVATISSLTLCEYLFDTDFGIDRLLIPGGSIVTNADTSLPGRMSPHTAFNFVLASCALMVLNVETRRGIRPSEFLALTAACVSLLALVGYVYSTAFLYRISPQTGMALHTAATFLMLSAGVMLAHPRRGMMAVVTSYGMGGVVARRLLAASVIIPLLLGWLTMIGQQMELFDAAISSSLLVVGSILVLSALVWSSAKTLDRVDAKRRVAEEARTQLLHRVVRAQEEERRRIARELHDQMGQHLAALALKLELHRTALQTTGTAPEAHLAQVFELTDRLARETNALAWELRPPELDHLGLQAALTRYVEQWSNRSGIVADFVCTGFGDSRLPPEVEVTLYRVMQEALTNVLKHARAQSVSLILERSQGAVLAVVEDDGCGFDAEAFGDASPASGGLGLLGMRERVELVNGTLKIESAPDAGTTLVVRIPLTPADENRERHE